MCHPCGPGKGLNLGSYKTNIFIYSKNGEVFVQTNELQLQKNYIWTVIRVTVAGVNFHLTIDRDAFYNKECLYHVA